MTVTVRITQRCPLHARDAFLALERRFVALEGDGALPAGRRIQPVLTGCPANTMIWEAVFPRAGSAIAALESTTSNPAHAALFEELARYIEDSRVELFEILDPIG
jgi:hypothetical protein